MRRRATARGGHESARHGCQCPRLFANILKFPRTHRTASFPAAVEGRVTSHAVGEDIDPHSLAALAQENALLRKELACAKEQLVRSEERTRRILEQAPLAYHSLHQDGTLRTVSQGWLDLFGYERGEVIGVSFATCVAPESREALRRNFQTMMETGRTTGFECTGQRKNGQRFIFAIDGMTVRAPGGHLHFTHCLLRDITAQRAAQAVLEQSEGFYRTVFDSAALPIAIARNLVIIYANQAMADIVGCAGPGELLGQAVQSHLPPHEAERFVDRARRRLHGEPVPAQYETEVLRLDGTTFWALATASVVQLPDGPATIGFFQDISAQKRIADSLRQSEARFRKLFDEVPAIAVQGYAEDRTVIYWNTASQALYGYRAEEALGRKLEDLIIPPAMRAQVVEHVRAWSEEGIAIPSGELLLMRKDGSLVPVFSCHVMQKIDETRSELYCLDVDLSELHAVQRELTRARDAAEAANKAKSEFLANMSHEIRTPMNGVLGMLQLLMDGRLVGEQQEFVELAFKSSRRLLGLLNDILDFSRIESGKMDLADAPLKLGEVLESVLRVFLLNAERSGLALTMSVDKSAEVPLLGDEARLRQILFNLVGNAVKFTRQGGVHLEVWARPEIAAGADALRVYVSVSDTGMGIPEDKIPFVFERFTQTDSSYTRGFEGAGLGLAIVKRIVDLMGGHVVVDSEVGHGTTVCVQLSLKLDPSARSPGGQDDGALTSVAESALSILVAEDDRISQMFMRQQLARYGHHVRLVSNGREAVEAVGEQHFDCVLMDVQMPELDGLEATRIIRGQDTETGRAPLRIIAMTAYALAGDREKFLSAGMDDYISKPVQNEELVRVLERVRKA